MRKRVLVVFETAWDRPQLAACRDAWSASHEVEFARPSDAEATFDTDVLACVHAEVERGRGRLQGVFSSSDYPGATSAAAIAAGLGLPGPRPEAVMRASHKYASRLVQREVAPEVCPGFDLIDPDDRSTWQPAIGFPCFVKPVKGSFSVLSGVFERAEDLAGFLGSARVAEFRSSFMAMFNALARHYGFRHDGRYFIAEELLHGRQVTVEAWRSRRASGLLGVVDSAFHAGTRSFERFDYPSDLPGEVQARMAALSQRVAEALGIVDTLYNVELVWDPDTERLGLIEVNPRACGQFADLYQKVDGVNGYQVALALATGDEPPVGVRRGAFAAAASFPLRVFAPTRVARAPDAQSLAALARGAPDALVWTECLQGDCLLDMDELEDGQSHRYAVVNLGGSDRADLGRRLARTRAVLGYELEPLAG